MDDLDTLLRNRAQDTGAPMPVPDALMARILADAAREQPQPAKPALAALAAQRKVSARMTFGQIIADLFGGTGVLAGLATAACAGVYLGLAQPAAISDVTLALLGASSAVDQLDFMPSIDTVLTEE